MNKPSCRYCGGRTHYRGTRKGPNEVEYRRYKCTKCKKWDKVLVEDSYPRQPKILLFDIETAPMEVFVWELKQDGWIPPSNIIKDWCVLSWAAKWLYQGRIYSEVLTVEEAHDRDDLRILPKMWELLNEADVVITHNGNKFDIKKLNTRFLIHDYPPPHSYQSIDTWAVAKKHFKFSSNGIDHINYKLGLPPKSDSGGMEGWRRCVSGIKEIASPSLKQMIEYNQQDVAMMEETYLKLRPWISNHPNLALLANMDGSACPVCQSRGLKIESLYSTHVGQYAEYRCQDCGAIGRGKKNISPKNDNLKRPLSNPYPRSIPKVT